MIRGERESEGGGWAEMAGGHFFPSEVMRGRTSSSTTNKLLLLQRFCGSVLLLGSRELGCVAHEETAVDVEASSSSWRGGGEGSGIGDGDGRAGGGTRRRRVDGGGGGGGGGGVMMVEQQEQQRGGGGGGQGVQWVFLGCPGLGKGTYASRLSKLLQVPHIAMGDLVRQELSKSSSMASPSSYLPSCM